MDLRRLKLWTVIITPPTLEEGAGLVYHGVVFSGGGGGGGRLLEERGREGEEDGLFSSPLFSNNDTLSLLIECVYERRTADDVRGPAV